MLEQSVAREQASAQLAVQRRIAKQLADMSDSRFFDGKPKTEKIHGEIKEQLKIHAVPVLARRLPEEPDFEIRESLAWVLGATGDDRAIEAVARAVGGEERTRKSRQDLLSKYYLEPSRARSEEAAQILKSAVAEAKSTLRILQRLNIAVFAVGLLVLAFGLYTSIQGQDIAARVTGGLASIGGLAGVIVQLIRDPIDRIQNAMANLVQIETAFTSFIWELNLNGTYIQSLYVADGRLTDDAIKETIGRIEGAMHLAMNLVAVYTEEGGQRVVTRINKLSPAVGKLGSAITISGQHLCGDSSQKREQRGVIAINHTPVEVSNLSWNEHEIKFKLPETLDHLGSETGVLWVSLFVDGLETNALPFHLLKEVS
jgi:hypothetical protein